MWVRRIREAITQQNFLSLSPPRSLAANMIDANAAERLKMDSFHKMHLGRKKTYEEYAFETVEKRLLVMFLQLISTNLVFFGM